MDKNIGKRIKELREKFNITQEKLAKRIGIPRPAVSQIESGKREITSTELKKISEIFEISIDELLSPQGIEKKDVNSKRRKSPRFNKETFTIYPAELRSQTKHREDSFI